METAAALITSTVIVIIILIIAAYVWYNYIGWSGFAYKTGDRPSWLPASGVSISRLRFKDCIFTVTRADKKVSSLDVAPVLNAMAVAYKTSTVGIPQTLTLTRPLNPFSFVIKGFNDRATVSDPRVYPWCTAPPAACTTDSDCPGGACITALRPILAGAAVTGTSVTKMCSTCPGGAVVTLTGKVRTI
jgi:hypothetical protein